jgi:hypothetical protein
VSGTVKKISVRATEIETFQRQTVILPNSELINSAVGNWTHRNKLGRVDIPVGVAYGVGRQAHALLLDLARRPSAGAQEPGAVRRCFPRSRRLVDELRDAGVSRRYHQWRIRAERPALRHP